MSAKKYALYRGDDLLGIGTAEELARARGVKPDTIRFYSMPSYQRRGKETGRRLVAVRIEED